MISRILIPIDFSPMAARAAAWGIDLAKQIGCEVLVVSVLDVADLRVAMNAGLHGFETDEQVRQQVKQWVDAQYAKIVPADAGHVKREIRRGIVEKEIVAAIAEYDPQLVIMGSAGIASRLPLGSKTEYVMRHCHVPVTVVRAE